MLQSKRVRVVTNTVLLLENLLMPFSNCWSMNEFGAGPNVRGPEDELGDRGESNDSSTVGSEPAFAGAKGFDPVLLELVGIASKDWDRQPFGFSSLPGTGERRLLGDTTAEADELLPRDGPSVGNVGEVLVGAEVCAETT